MAGNESVTDYLIRAENTITALRDAGETMSDGLTIAMILGGLPDSFKPLAVHVTQNEDKVMFTDFKRRLRVYEEAEKMNVAETTDNVMKTSVKQGRGPTKTSASNRKNEDTNVTCVELKGTRHENVFEKCGAITVKITHIKNPCARKREDKMASEKLQKKKMATKTTYSK